MIPWLARSAPFPPVESALRRPNGLLAAGGDLSPERLLDAYSHGIFPWYSEGEPILWWSPDPRMVLVPADVRLSHSLRKRLKRPDYDVRLDTSFGDVIAACAEQPRRGQDGTWITPDMQDAYIRLHELGWAHSVEVYAEGDLTGGLYGIGIGRMFYGESMFSRRSDASKIAFAHLVRYLLAHDFTMIDCQMRTEHLVSLGGREIPRDDFLNRLQRLTQSEPQHGRWTADGLDTNW